MLKVTSAEPGVGAASAAAGSAWLAVVADFAMQVFGVPLPVVLCAAAGAFIARSYAPAVNFIRALAASCAWVCAGGGRARVGLWGGGLGGGVVPATVLAGLAFAIAAAGPLLWPVVIEKLPEIVRARLDRLKGGKDVQS